MAAYDQATKKHSLHMVEPSGVSYEYFGAAAGRGRQPARTEMEKLAINPKNSGGDAGDDGEPRRRAEEMAHRPHRTPRRLR